MAVVAIAPTNVKKVSFYRPELDALRFVAFFTVFLCHLPLPKTPVFLLISRIKTAGSSGVDLFFVLSAYLITELLLREKESTGKLDVKAFYVRRILRIWPLYFFFLGIALIPIFNRAHVLNWQYIASFLLLAGNWGFFFFGFPWHTITFHLWSISLEEQFYLTWPLIVRNLTREGIVKAAVVMLVLASAFRGWMVHAGTASGRIGFATFSRLDPMACGILVACLLKGRMPRLNLPTRIFLAAGGSLAIVLVSWFNNADKGHAPGALTMVSEPVVAIACTMLLIAALGIPYKVPEVLSYLGKISYGLYIYHILGLWIADRVSPYNSAATALLGAVVGMTITVMLSVYSYRYLESPFLRIKDRFARVSSRPV